MIILATARDPLRAACLAPLVADGHAVAPVSSWSGLCRAVTDPLHPLLLVDPELPGLDAALLAGLAGTMPHRPVVRTLDVAVPPLQRTAATPATLARLARRSARVRPSDLMMRRTIRYLGLGEAPLVTLTNLAASQVPVLVSGERGTGKKRVARLIHAISGRLGPFHVVDADAPLELPAGPPGMVYFASASQRESLRGDVRAARAAGWAVAAGTRERTAPGGAAWVEVQLPPLRERPEDLRALGQMLLDDQAHRLGLPRRSFDRSLWNDVLAHRWPANARELEEFVVAAVAAVDRAVIRAKDLPPAVARRLAPPDDRVEGELGGFEAVAAARLAPVVQAYTPGGGTSLWEIAMGATTRVLLRLALARTEGNRKAAAELLGIARNTLAAHIEKYGLSAAPR